MTAESEYYILSETGFGGRAFRVTEKYLEQAETIDHVAPEPQIDLDGEVVTIGRKQNSRGILYTVAARLRAPIPTRTRLALFEPADPDEYSDYVAEKLDVPLPTTTLPPTEYAQKALRESDQKTNQQPLAGESKLTFSNFERSLTSPTILPGIRAQAEALEKYGFWSNEHSFNRYQMRLSPDRCPITTEDLKQFQELTQAMFAKPRGILPGVARLLYDWQQYSDFANLGSPLMENTVAALNYLAALPVQRPDTYPRVVRLDLGRSVVNGKRTYTIFELEGTKTHAFGYVTLTETLDSSNRSNSRFTTLFYEQLRQKGWEDQDVFLVIGGAINEEFYGPELRFFVDQVNSTFGTRLRIIQEDGIAREGENTAC